MHSQAIPTFTPPPVVIAPLDPKNLHQVWPLIRRGVADIRRKIQECDFIEEDIFANVRSGAATVHLATRGQRWLGFTITYPQVRPFSGKKELFLWLAWALPLRERIEDDNVEEATYLMRDYLKQHAKSLGCERILHLSSRRGFQKWGFTPTIMVWTLLLD